MDSEGSSSVAETVCAPAATCLIASPRSQQELRLKPTTSLTQNQRGQLARVQIVVVDRRTPSALRKEPPTARANLLIHSATRCQQGLSQLRVKDSMIKNGALRRHTATLCSDTRRLSLRLPVSRYFGAYLRQQSTVNN